MYVTMDCGTTNLHYCDECEERKREVSFTYQVIKKETVKKNVISLKDLEEGVYKPVELIEDEKMRVLKLEDEKGEFYFVDQNDYRLNKHAVFKMKGYHPSLKIEKEEKETKEVDLLNVLEALVREKDGNFKTQWKKS